MSNGTLSHDLSSVNWKEVLLIIAGGAIGGLLSWVYSITLGLSTVLAGWQAVVASVTLGMGASFLGVYLIANTDTAPFYDALGFAVLCGFAWKPIYDGGAHLLTRQLNNKRSAGFLRS